MSSSSTPAADPDAPKRAWRSYFESTQRLQDLLERELKSHCGMTLPDYNVLLLLVEADDGRLRLGELATRMVFSPSRVTYQVTSLVDRGLVERRRVECDRRGYEAVITDAGRDAFRRASIVHARQVDELFLDLLAPDEVEVLERVFARVGAELEDRR